MKNRKIKKLLIASVMGIVSLAMPLTLTGCSNIKTNIDQDKLNNLVIQMEEYYSNENEYSNKNYIDNTLAWNIFTEAKYKINTSYQNCLSNFKIESENYYQDSTQGSKSKIEYIKINTTHYDSYYVIRHSSEDINITSSKEDIIYYNNNSMFDVISNKTTSNINYDKFKYNNQMGVLTNDDIIYDNLLTCELTKDGNYIFKFSKTFDSANDYEDYDAYYEVILSKDQMFCSYRSYYKTNSSSGYTQSIENYSYNTVDTEQTLDLIENQLRK